MIDFALEEWEWPQGAERRYAIGPFESDCLREAGLKQAIICVVPFPGSPRRHKLGNFLDQLLASTRGNSPEHLCFFRPTRLHANSQFSLGANATSTNYILSFKEVLFTYDDIDTDEEDIWCIRGDIEATLRIKSRIDLRPARYFNLPIGPCSIHQDKGVWDDSFSPTSFRVPTHWWQLPSAQLYAELVQALAGEGEGAGDDAVAEVLYSYQHHNKSTDQITATVYEFAPAIEQRQRLMEAIARLELRFDELLGWKVNALSPLDSGSQLTCHRRDATTWHPDLWERLCLWHQILQRTLPLPALEHNPAPLCLLEDYRSKASYLHVYGEENSAHEQLEAGLFLREWVKDKATEEEFAILFPAG